MTQFGYASLMSSRLPQQEAEIKGIILLGYILAWEYKNPSRLMNNQEFFGDNPDISTLVQASYSTAKRGDCF